MLKLFEKNIRTLFKTACFLIPVLQVTNCPAQTLDHFNGWEFLPWKTDSAQVQIMVERNRKKLQEPNGLDADFKYQNLNTWLEYKNHQLYKVRQEQDFGVNRNEEAQEEYEKTRARLIRSYGMPHTENKDTIAQNIHLEWDLEYTRIHLEYDYKYKIIDELGAGSYWVEVTFEEKQE